MSTFQEQRETLGIALKNLVDEIMKSLRVHKLLDWLTKQLNRNRK